MTERSVRRTLWAIGGPARLFLIVLIRVYRVTLGQMVGGGCRFHPSCSAYAEDAIRNTGALRGSLLAGWRVLRCSPLSKGGVDYPPKPAKWRSRYVVDIHLPGKPAQYDNLVHRANRNPGSAA